MSARITTAQLALGIEAILAEVRELKSRLDAYEEAAISKLPEVQPEGLELAKAGHVLRSEASELGLPAHAKYTCVACTARKKNPSWGASEKYVANHTGETHDCKPIS